MYVYVLHVCMHIRIHICTYIYMFISICTDDTYGAAAYAANEQASGNIQ
jgi:hypothetical protein